MAMSTLNTYGYIDDSDRYTTAHVKAKDGEV